VICVVEGQLVGSAGGKVGRRWKLEVWNALYQAYTIHYIVISAVYRRDIDNVHQLKIDKYLSRLPRYALILVLAVVHSIVTPTLTLDQPHHDQYNHCCRLTFKSITHAMVLLLYVVR
jgi:hypothetical protein